MANSSWAAFSQIHYFSSWAKEFSNDRTRFIAEEQCPKILRMVEHAASTPGWSAIVNADIVIGPSIGKVMAKLNTLRCRCAVSRRYQFSGASTAGAKLVDMGLDFFLARQSVWEEIAKEYPESYRMGHPGWDTIMLGAFNCIGKRDHFDITDSRVVFHPLHAERRTVFRIDESEHCRFVRFLGFPSKRIG
jgi:hypothetical protein